MPDENAKEHLQEFAPLPGRVVSGRCSARFDRADLGGELLGRLYAPNKEADHEEGNHPRRTV